MFAFARNTVTKENREDKMDWLLILIAAGLAVRIILSFIFPGHPIDINCFKAWALSAASNLAGFYTSGQFADYPPLYIYILFIIGKIALALNLAYESAAFNALVKIPSIIADAAISIVIIKLIRQNTGRVRFGYIIPFVLYLFNPVAILNSAVWGQVDAVFTLFIMLMLLYINKKPEASAVFITLAVLMKPQGLIFTPLILLELYKRKDFKLLIKSAIYSVSAFILLILPFSFKQGPLWIFKLYFKTSGEYKYASLNAFNLFMLAGGNWKNDAETFLLFSYSTWGIIFIVGLTALVSYLYLKSKNRDTTAVYCGILLISGTFLLSSRMHERYMFPVIALLAVVYGIYKERRILVVLLGLSFTNFINTFAVLYDAQRKVYWIPANDPAAKMVALLNLLLFAYMIKITVDILIKNKVKAENKIPEIKRKASVLKTANKTPVIMESYIKPERLGVKDLLIMSAIALAYLAVSIANLGGSGIPETSWKPLSIGESFTVQFDREYDLSRVYYYNGYGDAKLKLEYRTAGGSFQPLAAIDKTYLDFYSWRFAKVNAKAIEIRITAESYELLHSAKAQAGPFLEMAFVEEGSVKPIVGLKIISENSVKPGIATGHGIATEPGIATGSGIKTYPGIVTGPGSLFDEQEKMEYLPSNKTGTIFDEIYHVRTAYEFLNGLTPFENTHPPLGKTIISLGIVLFGMNPFGWRIMGVIAGIAIIPVMYLFGRKLFGSRLFGFFSAFLMMTDFMNLVQARIGTVDVYAVLFIMLMYYFMFDSFIEKSYEVSLKKAMLPLFLSGLFFGIGASAKWISIYAGAGLALMYFWARWKEYAAAGREPGADIKRNTGTEDNTVRIVNKKVLQRISYLSIWCVLFFVIIPAGIYIISYIPFFGDKDLSLKDVWVNQIGMFSYHSKLESTHSFGSEPWSWPFMVKPVWFYTNAENAFAVKTVSTIVTMGNPAIWWVGMVCVPAAAIIAWKKRDRYFLPVFIGLAFQYIPWFFVTRLMFIYHFYSSVPFVILCIVYVLKYLIENYSGMKAWAYGYLAAASVLFIMFYPVLTGLEVSRSYIENYLRWFKNTWYF